MIEAVKNMQIENSRIPKRYLRDFKIVPQECDVEAFKRIFNIALNIKTFVSDGHSLLLHSKNCGNGKTTIVCKLAMRYINDYSSNYSIEVPVVFVNAAEYINRKKAAISDKQLIDVVNKLDKDIYSADIVIWDDIATKSLSEYDTEQLYTFINNRYSNSKSNFFTSNCSKSELASILGDRLASRVINGSIEIELKGFDNRKDAF